MAMVYTDREALMSEYSMDLMDLKAISNAAVKRPELSENRALVSLLNTLLQRFKARIAA